MKVNIVYDHNGKLSIICIPETPFEKDAVAQFAGKDNAVTMALNGGSVLRCSEPVIIIRQGEPVEANEMEEK